MATDLTVILEDRPGELARLGEVTGEAGVNIEGMCALTGQGRGYIHLLVADEKASAARVALEGAGMGVAEQLFCGGITFAGQWGQEFSCPFVLSAKDGFAGIFERATPPSEPLCRSPSPLSSLRCS